MTGAGLFVVMWLANALMPPCDECGHLRSEHHPRITSGTNPCCQRRRSGWRRPRCRCADYRKPPGSVTDSDLLEPSSPGIRSRCVTGYGVGWPRHRIDRQAAGHSLIW